MNTIRALTLVRSIMDTQSDPEARSVCSDLCALITDSMEMIDTAKRLRDILLPIYGCDAHFTAADVFTRARNPKNIELHLFLKQHNGTNALFTGRLLNTSPQGMFFEKYSSRGVRSYRIVRKYDMPAWM